MSPDFIKLAETNSKPEFQMTKTPGFLDVMPSQVLNLKFKKFDFV
jgi:hypothetical protein